MPVRSTRFTVQKIEIAIPCHEVGRKNGYLEVTTVSNARKNDGKNNTNVRSNRFLIGRLIDWVLRRRRINCDCKMRNIIGIRSKLQKITFCSADRKNRTENQQKKTDIYELKDDFLRFIFFQVGSAGFTMASKRHLSKCKVFSIVYHYVMCTAITVKKVIVSGSWTYFTCYSLTSRISS